MSIVLYIYHCDLKVELFPVTVTKYLLYLDCL